MLKSNLIKLFNTTVTTNGVKADLPDWLLGFLAALTVGAVLCLVAMLRKPLFDLVSKWFKKKK